MNSSACASPPAAPPRSPPSLSFHSSSCLPSPQAYPGSPAFNAPVHIQYSLPPSPPIPIRSTLRQAASNPRLVLGASSSRSTVNIATPPPPSPSQPLHPPSFFPSNPRRSSWLSGVSSLSLPNPHILPPTQSDTASSRLSVSTAGDSGGGGVSGRTFYAAPTRKGPVSAPFMFPIRAAPSPTHSVSMLSPVLLDITFEPAREAPSPALTPIERSVTAITNTTGGDRGITPVGGIGSEGGNGIGTGKSPKRSHILWPPSWRIFRAYKKFQDRHHKRETSLPTSTTVATQHSPLYSQTSPLQRTSAPQHTSAVPSSFAESTDHQTSKGIGSTLENAQGTSHATVMAQIPQQPLNGMISGPNSNDTWAAAQDSPLPSPPLAPIPRTREDRGCLDNKIVSAVGELGGAVSGIKHERGIPGSAEDSRTKPSRQNSNRITEFRLQERPRKGKVPRRGNVTLGEGLRTTATPSLSRAITIRRNSVVGYIYPCHTCTRNWLEECSCPSEEEGVSGLEHGGESGRTAPMDVQQLTVEEVSSSPSVRPKPPERRNPRFAETWRNKEARDVGQVILPSPGPQVHPQRASPTSPNIPKTRGWFGTFSNRRGRGGSADFGKEVQVQGGPFSWSNLSLPLPRPSSSPSTWRKAPGPRPYLQTTQTGVRTHIAQFGSGSPQPPSEAPISSSPNFSIHPAASTLLGINQTLAAPSPRRSRGGATQSPHHQRHSSASSIATASTQSHAAPLRLWSSRGNSEAEHHSVVIVNVDRGSTEGSSGSARGRLSLRSVASAAGSGIRLGDGGEDELDPVRERERMRKGLVALGLLDEEVVEERASQGKQAGGSLLEKHNHSKEASPVMLSPTERGWKGSFERALRR